jgi:hypothetical protein
MEEKMKEEKQLTEVSVGKLKKTYSKPAISQIQLVAEEAVLALCKYGNGSASRMLCSPDRTCISMRRS